MYCESFLRVFKYKYLKGKLNKRVDKCFLNLIKFNRDKIFDVINSDSNSRNIDDFHCLKSKTEGYVLELLNQTKNCNEFDKEKLLHTAKQICSLKNTMISLNNTSKQKN